jgi:hypothetical protein
MEEGEEMYAVWNASRCSIVFNAVNTVMFTAKMPTLYPE